MDTKENRRMDTRILEQEGAGELCLEQLQAIETGWTPKVETALLRDLLKQALGRPQSLADPTEAQNDRAFLASLNTYKHRLHALRCEYADARLHGLELEDQLGEARLRILRLEARIKHLDATLEQIHASRVWKVRERCARCWRAVSRWLPYHNRAEGQAVPLPNPRGSDG